MRYRLILFFVCSVFSALADFSRDSRFGCCCIDTEEFDTTWNILQQNTGILYDVNNLLIAQEVLQYFRQLGGLGVVQLFIWCAGGRIVSLYQIFSVAIGWIRIRFNIVLINGSLSLTSNYSAGSWLPLQWKNRMDIIMFWFHCTKQVQHANGNSWENYSKNEITGIRMARLQLLQILHGNQCMGIYRYDLLVVWYEW